MISMSSYSLCRLLFKLLLLSSCSPPVVMCISRMSSFGVYLSFGRTMTMTNSKVSRLFSSSSIVKFANNADDTTDVYNDYPTIHKLLQRARKVRRRIDDDTFIHDSSKLSYPTSAYNMKAMEGSNKDKTVQRGFCNWLIPQTIMIGQYPGMTPESYGPALKESNIHIQNMITDANISLFCCLQTEVPAQDDDIKWNNNGGEIYLEPDYLRREFPRPFTRYAPIAESFASENQQQLTFIHNPIEDLNIPTCNDDLLSLLSQLLYHLEDNGIIYLHCWGGRGRAGLVGACLACLIFPEMSSKDILDWVQRGYDTRLGAEYMPNGLKRSPQTQQQRQFVTEFVDNVHSGMK